MAGADCTLTLLGMRGWAAGRPLASSPHLSTGYGLGGVRAVRVGQVGGGPSITTNVTHATDNGFHVVVPPSFLPGTYSIAINTDNSEADDDSIIVNLPQVHASVRARARTPEPLCLCSVAGHNGQGVA